MPSRRRASATGTSQSSSTGNGEEVGEPGAHRVGIRAVEETEPDAAEHLPERGDPPRALHERPPVEQHPPHRSRRPAGREVEPLLDRFAGQEHQGRLVVGERGAGQHVRRVVDPVDLLRRAPPVDQAAEHLEKRRLGRNGQADVPVDVAEPLDGVAEGERLALALPVVGGRQQLARGGLAPGRRRCLHQPLVHPAFRRSTPPPGRVSSSSASRSSVLRPPMYRRYQTSALSSSQIRLPWSR